MRKLQHSKKRNTGLVYEFLARDIAAALVAGDKRRAAEALRIVNDHLSEGSVLHPELSLHRSVMETRGISERLAKRIVDELKAAGIRSSTRRNIIEQAKTDLIHEMNRTLGRDIFDRYRVPDYTAHASVGILLSRGLDRTLDEAVDLARVEEHLTEFLMSPADVAEAYDPDRTMYAYKTALGLFEQQYGRELCHEQVELLREYVKTSLGGNPAPFKRVFERQRGELSVALRARRADEVFKTDPDMAGRLDEAIADLESLQASPDDDVVEKIMVYHNLVREINSQ